VHFFRTFHEAKAPAQFVVERIGIVTHYVKPAAFGRAFRSKRPNNDVASSLNRVRHPLDVSRTLLLRSKKMEHGAIVPHVISLGLKDRLGNIADDPMNALGGFFQAPSGYVDRRLGNVQDGDILIASR